MRRKASIVFEPLHILESTCYYKQSKPKQILGPSRGILWEGVFTICDIGLAAKQPAVGEWLPYHAGAKHLIKQLPVILGRGSVWLRACSSGEMNGESPSNNVVETFPAEKSYKYSRKLGQGVNGFPAEIGGNGESPEVKCLRGLKSLLLNPTYEDRKVPSRLYS